MRTTVTLDPDVESLIRDAMRERDISFKETLNEAARARLCGKAPQRATKFVQKTFRMGEAQEFGWYKALAVADAIEDEELSRKLAFRKLAIENRAELCFADTDFAGFHGLKWRNPLT